MTTLHVTNGDSTAMTMRAAGVSGEVLVWRDILHAGPVPLADPADLRTVRAGYLAGQGYADHAAVLADMTERDRVLDGHGGDVELWFEADLYDQLQLIEILSRLDSRGADPAHVRLVCVGEFPGHAHFGGLGELTPTELATLGPGRPLTAAALTLATRAWQALRSPEPTGLAAIDSSDDLRFLGEAFDRLAREYPSTRDGLSLTERRILAGVASGPRAVFELFRQVWLRERHPFLGDTTFIAIVGELAPLVIVDDGWVSISDDGRRVLDGQADRVELVGIDRWIGGVHLTDGRWRFDEGRETVVGTLAR